MGDVCWVDAPEDASGTREVAALVVRWGDRRINGWLARSPPDPADLARFAGRADAGQRIVRRRLARLLLATAVGVDGREARLIDGPLGAVAVAAPAGWHVSLAGSGSWCAIAIAREPLGIDIEAIAGDPLPSDLLTTGEQTWLATLPENERLAASLACWTGKEAHAKRLGRPREDDPATIEALGGQARSPAGMSSLAMWSGEGWIVAVARSSRPS